MTKTNFVPLLLPLLCCSLVFRVLAQEQTQTLNAAGGAQKGEPQSGGAQQGQPQAEQSAVETKEGQGESPLEDVADQIEKGTTEKPPPQFADNKSLFNFYPKVTIDIMNGLPPNSPPLIANCKSKNDDFGNRSLDRWAYFSWRFKPSVWGITLYWCNLWWGSQHVKFEAYNEDLGKGQCKVGYKEAGDPNYKDTNVCHWQARADGIYFTPFIGIGQHQNDPKWVKKFEWGKIYYGNAPAGTEPPPAWKVVT